MSAARVGRAAAALLGGLAGLALAACDESGEPARVVGQLESERVELVAETSEPIVERAVAEGERVDAGDIIIRQDTARIGARVAEARAALEQARARLDERVRGPRRERIRAARADVTGARQELEFRAADYERARRVYERNLAAPDTVDRAETALDAARATLEAREARLEELLAGTTVEEIRQAESAVAQQQARLDALEVDAARHEIRAPVAGVIDTLLFETGERPPAGQPAAILLGASQPYARVYVPESLRAAIAPGTAVRVHVDGMAETIEGRVRWVATEAAFTPYFALTERDRGRLTYLAKIDLERLDRRLPDGLPVEVELPAARR